MTNDDPFATQRDVTPNVTDELCAAGFDDPHLIGRGGFGVVYRCSQPSLDRTVAVKVLASDLDEDNRARFFREQRAMGRLTGHPNIVNVLHVGTTDSGRPYIVMLFHPHDSLDVQIRRHGPFSLADTRRLGVKISGALETAHRLDILHRDVKPANILVTDYGEPALTDFGIARLREQGIPADLSAVIEQAMAADPQDRPATAIEVGEALRRIQLRGGFRSTKYRCRSNPRRRRAISSHGSHSRTRHEPPWLRIELWTRPPSGQMRATCRSNSPASSVATAS